MDWSGATMTPEFEDCTDVLRSLYAFHDNELTAAEADEIRQHLMRCCAEEKAPEGLRMRMRATYSRTVIGFDSTE